MEGRALVGEFLAARALAFFTGAKGAEVFDRLGHHVTEKAHGDAARGLAADLDVEVNYIMPEESARETNSKAAAHKKMKHVKYSPSAFLCQAKLLKLLRF